MIKIHNLVTGYYGQNISPSINGNIIKGSTVAVIGSNGTGKSAFLKTLAGFLSPISGKLEFNSKNKFNISYLPQKKNINYHVPITVFDVVSMGCWPKINFFKRIDHCQKCLIWKALEKVRLINLLNRCIDSLSEGQIQRMLFARILVQQSPLILLDEPFQGVDKFTCDILMQSIYQLQKMGCTILVVLHNEAITAKYFSKILLFTKNTSIWKELK